MGKQWIDLTIEVSPRHEYESERYKFLDSGHLGTHFDVMNKQFPIEYVERPGIAFDVAAIRDRDIEETDIDMVQVKPDMFVAFRTGFIEEKTYGTRDYFDHHPQLSDALIEALLDRGISILAVDCAGIRRGKEHTPKDQHCADRGVFVVENICNVDKVLDGQPSRAFVAHTYPVRFAGMTGLPCRVVASLE